MLLSKTKKTRSKIKNKKLKRYMYIFVTGVFTAIIICACEHINLQTNKICWRSYGIRINRNRIVGPCVCRHRLRCDQNRKMCFHA